MEFLHSFRVQSAPDTFFYVPEFVSGDEETYLLRQVRNAPLPRWQQLSNRRLQNWGGLPHPRGMVPDTIPAWLQTPINRVTRYNCFSTPGQSTAGVLPNHVLVNEYLPGQGIMPHTDGPLFHPVICTVSLGSHTILDLYRRGDSAEAKDSDVDEHASPRLVGCLLLERRSLLVVRDEGYSDLMHGIAERHEDTLTDLTLNIGANRSIGDVLRRDVRVSLTIRHVPKVLKLKLHL